jgi:hypothetical protein
LATWGLLGATSRRQKLVLACHACLPGLKWVGLLGATFSVFRGFDNFVVFFVCLFSLILKFLGFSITIMIVGKVYNFCLSSLLPKSETQPPLFDEAINNIARQPHSIAFEGQSTICRLREFMTSRDWRWFLLILCGLDLEEKKQYRAVHFLALTTCT